MDNYSVKKIAQVRERNVDAIFDRVDNNLLGYQYNNAERTTMLHFVKVPKGNYHHGPNLLTRFNFNPIMDKQSHSLIRMGK